MPGWMTRRSVRSRTVETDSERRLQRMLNAYDKRMGRLNEQYLRMMGEHIRNIGTMWPSDVHRLQQIRRMNKNLAELQHQIRAAAGMSEDEIRGIFEQIAQDDVRMAQKILGVPDTINVKDNLPLQRILRAQARETAYTMRNMSNTTVISKYYRHAVDEAVIAVQSGVEDYGSAIRRVIREAGQNGLRIDENGTRKVDYESGYTRRLDTAARMNILDGARHLNQSIMEEVGRQFGANGVEIDAHMLCAEDHLPYQGGQFSNEEFEQIQDSLQRPFGEWNCRHSWHPIMLGISPPTYTQDQLEQFERYSTEPVTIDGRTKTRYQWSQEMRRCETAIRQQKDTATLARYAGDESLRRRCQRNIVELNRHYEQLADRAGLDPEHQRTFVQGFRDAKTVKAEFSGSAAEVNAIRLVKIFSGKGSTSSSSEGQSASHRGDEPPVSKCKTFLSLTAYMKSRYNVSVDVSTFRLRFDDVRRSMSGLETVLRRFPAAAKALERIGLGDNSVPGNKNTFMGTRRGEILFYPHGYAKGEGNAAAYEAAITRQRGGIWVRNASVESIGAHEGGHLLEEALILRNPVYTTDFSRNRAWNERIEAGRLVDRACANLRQTEYGAARTHATMRRDISKLASTNKAETLAEAVADWYCNGDSAQPLSLEIIRLLDEALS